MSGDANCHVIKASVCLDVSIALAILMFLWGKLCTKVSGILMFHQLDISITDVIETSVCVDVSIARAILIFIWG